MDKATILEVLDWMAGDRRQTPEVLLSGSTCQTAREMRDFIKDAVIIPKASPNDNVLLTRCDNKAQYHWGQRAWPVYSDGRGDRYCTVSIDDMQVLTGRVLNGTLFQQEEVTLMGNSKYVSILMFEGELCYIMPKAFLVEAFGATHKVAPKTHGALAKGGKVYELIERDDKEWCLVPPEEARKLFAAEPVPSPLDPIAQLSQHHDEHVPFKGAMYKGELIALSVTMPAGELHVRLD